MDWHTDVVMNLWYVKPCSTCWFDDIPFDVHILEQWNDVVRMRRKTFERLCDDLRPRKQGHNTSWREPISIDCT